MEVRQKDAYHKLTNTGTSKDCRKQNIPITFSWKNIRGVGHRQPHIRTSPKCSWFKPSSALFIRSKSGITSIETFAQTRTSAPSSALRCALHWDKKTVISGALPTGRHVASKAPSRMLCRKAKLMHAIEQPEPTRLYVRYCFVPKTTWLDLATMSTKRWQGLG